MSENVETNITVLSFDELIKKMPSRAEDSHKGYFGHSLLVGGNTGFSGAIRLASEAALRVGSGLVSVATKVEHAAGITMSRPELMCHGIVDAKNLLSLSKKCNVIGLGPGLGQTRWSTQLFEQTLDINLPTVVDADALNLLSNSPRKNNRWILTPHVGEAARLLKCSTKDIQHDRLAAVKMLQHQYGGVIVLKGSGSLIFDGEGDVYRCDAGNPGMASGGMGDVLTGVISGLVAQGLTCIEAAKLGVVLHATAGDRAALQGMVGLLASDLMQPIRELMNDH